MPRISPERRAAQRQRIVDAARTVMLREGLPATSMALVIEESGLSAGAIYGYFAGKDELVLGVALDVISSRLSGMDELATQRPVPPPAQALGDFIETLPRGDEGRLVLEIWAAAARSPELLARTTEVFGGLSRGATTYLQAWFTEGLGLPADEAAERSAHAVHALLGIAQGFIVQSAVLPGVDAATYRDSLEALFDDR
ncbi:TetR/AcrR family transcriptional regulator [Kytococcus sedentarius]|uniref:TetR/AcrR family transcriptional regulator n=1 Tax=Kytococcus sedentarius TaxID=1276 RepID=UPI0035BC5E36